MLGLCIGFVITWPFSRFVPGPQRGIYGRVGIRGTRWLGGLGYGLLATGAVFSIVAWEVPLWRVAPAMQDEPKTLTVAEHRAPAPAPAIPALTGPEDLWAFPYSASAYPASVDNETISAGQPRPPATATTTVPELPVDVAPERLTASVR